jgi:hypothetical protein
MQQSSGAQQPCRTQQRPSRPPATLTRAADEQVLHTRQQIAVFLFDNTPTRLSFSGAWPLLVAADDKARPPARTASLHRCIAAAQRL